MMMKLACKRLKHLHVCIAKGRHSAIKCAGGLDRYFQVPAIGSDPVTRRCFQSFHPGTTTPRITRRSLLSAYCIRRPQNDSEVILRQSPPGPKRIRCAPLSCISKSTRQSRLVMFETRSRFTAKENSYAAARGRSPQSDKLTPLQRDSPFCAIDGAGARVFRGTDRTAICAR